MIFYFFWVCWRLQLFWFGILFWLCCGAFCCSGHIITRGISRDQSSNHSSIKSPGVFEPADQNKQSYRQELQTRAERALMNQKKILITPKNHGQRATRYATFYCLHSLFIAFVLLHLIVLVASYCFWYNCVFSNCIFYCCAFNFIHCSNIFNLCTFWTWNRLLLYGILLKYVCFLCFPCPSFHVVKLG